MSMPSTCTTNMSVSNKIMSVHTNLICRILMPINEHDVRTYCMDSVKRIGNEYFGRAEVPIVRQVQDSVPEMSYTHALALFFLLLNIDTVLKKTIIDNESAQQQQKCVNFFKNLRRHVIPEFMSMEECGVRSFVAKCEHAWSVA